MTEGCDVWCLWGQAAWCLAGRLQLHRKQELVSAHCPQRAILPAQVPKWGRTTSPPPSRESSKTMSNYCPSSQRPTSSDGSEASEEAPLSPPATNANGSSSSSAKISVSSDKGTAPPKIASWTLTDGKMTSKHFTFQMDAVLNIELKTPNLKEEKSRCLEIR